MKNKRIVFHLKDYIITKKFTKRITEYAYKPQYHGIIKSKVTGISYQIVIDRYLNIDNEIRAKIIDEGEEWVYTYWYDCNKYNYQIIEMVMNDFLNGVIDYKVKWK